MNNQCLKSPSSKVPECTALSLRSGIYGWLLLAVLSTNLSAAVWQYSVPVGKDPLRRAYLWIPENCSHVRGVIIGIQNMLEEPMFADPTIRKAAADAELGIVWITPGDDAGDKNSPFHRFNPPQEITAQVQNILSGLAKESGYSEIESARLLPVAHSAATPFVWGMASTFGSARVFAMLPYKGWFGGLPPGIPALHVSSEYAEVGGTDWGETYLKDRVAVEKIRAGGSDHLIGEFVDIGAGHFEWNPDSAKVIAMFIRKAAQYRLPENAPLIGAVTLKPINPASGWLVDPATLGTARLKEASVKEWSGDPTKALWYFDKEMSEAVNDFMVAGLSKKPQVIDFLDDKGQPASLAKGGMADLHPTLLDDGMTFQVVARSLDKSPTANLYSGTAVGHAGGPILFKSSTGAIKQTGSNTFRIWMGRGGLIQQGSPWETVDYGVSTRRQGISPRRPSGASVAADSKQGWQTADACDFPKIENPKPGVKSFNCHCNFRCRPACSILRRVRPGGIN